MGEAGAGGQEAGGAEEAEGVGLGLVGFVGVGGWGGGVAEEAEVGVADGEMGVEAGAEDVEGDGFDDVVAGTDFEALGGDGDVGFAGEDDDGEEGVVVVPADFAEEFEAVHAGEFEVEDDGGEGGLGGWGGGVVGVGWGQAVWAEELEGVFCGEGLGDGEAFAFEEFGDEGASEGVILDEKDGVGLRVFLHGVRGWWRKGYGDFGDFGVKLWGCS